MAFLIFGALAVFLIIGAFVAGAFVAGAFVTGAFVVDSWKEL
jgi:hypothetical protein